MNFKLVNNLLGWVMFAIALVVYTLTLEPSVSLWDCGEFISASHKLQVVHPPGAPFFLLVGRFFSLFAPELTDVAFAVNMLSATASALTVLFTFWITTHFAKKIIDPQASKGSFIAVMGAGAIGALALTFMDSFWFSAVEAEVYALSSFFTAITFWAALKWEESDSKYANKWIILIAYLIGLAIGTHLLNLLVIPAIVFIYYFKNYKYTQKGLIYSFLVGLGILFFIQKGIIPGVPSLMAKMDLFFVNSLGFGFNSGTFAAILLLVAISVGGIYYYSKVKPNHYANLGFICFAYILLGYSSYAMVVIRSSDNPPIDMNNPEEPFKLLSYINREQYGDRPLLKGPYYNAQAIGVDEGDSVFRKDENSYTAYDTRKEYVFDPAYNTIFPRMGDMQKDGSEQGYRSWGNMNEISKQIDEAQMMLQQTQDPEQKQRLNNEIEALKAVKPKFTNNLSFLFRYQLGHMYFRYFMWNFVGRQNDQQGHDFNKETDGNWISGIGLVDAARLGPQNDLPEHLANNFARNKFYFIPLLIGIFGLIIHFKKGKNDAIVVMSLFLFTGILINIFLNQPPYEPRERDYSLAGSFQTFCIWIGLGVLFLWDKLKNKMAEGTAAILAAAIALIAPVLMGTQGWDDHDRSGRYLGIDFAKNYLHSCPENAILFTNGDNDTYPLWYAQNVEGIRTDVRIINQSLLPTDWYSQVLLDKVYKSEPLPLTLTKEQLKAGVNDYFQFQGKGTNPAVNLRDFINNLVNSKTPTFNTTNFFVPVNKESVLKAGVVSASDSANVVPSIIINFPGRGLNKGDLLLLDLIATNAEQGWKRPICFTTTSGSDGFLNMEPYFERRGLVFQLIPIKSKASRNNVTRLNEEVMYDNLMNKYSFSGMNKKEKYFLDDKAVIVPSNVQNLFISTAGHYLGKVDEIKFYDSTLSIPENKEKVALYKSRALNLIDKCLKEMPENVLITRGNTKYSIAFIYYELGEMQKAEKHLSELYEMSKKEVNYYLKYSGSSHKSYNLRLMTKDAFDTMERCAATAKQWNMESLANKMEKGNKEVTNAVSTFINND